MISDFTKSILQKTILLILLINIFQITFAQTSDSTSKIINFRGTSSITNNGFSFIPAFSLDRKLIVKK